jgi:hypothetical protein
MTLPVDPEAAADALIAAFANRSAPHIRTPEPSGWLVLPTVPPGELAESALEDQLCAVLQAGGPTYADLPLTAAPQALIERFAAEVVEFANFDAFDLARLRMAETPWLGGQFALLPHRENKIEVPFFAGDEDIVLAGRTNEWIYEAMSRRPPPQCDDNLLAYVRFFFTTVTGKLGKFLFADRVEDAVWLPEASAEQKQEFAGKLSPLRIIGTAEDGRQELRGTVIFKNALFMTSVMVTPNWEMKLVNEELLLEDLPIAEGPQIDLLVRR